MANNQSDSPSVFNPFLLWTDLGMRAAEMTVASMQNLTEGADRLTRAGASADGTDTEDTDSRSDDSATSMMLPAGLGGIASMQRLMWDLATQNWLRWTSAMSNLMSAGAGVALAHKVAGRDNPLLAMRDSLQPVAWADRTEASSGTGRRGDSAARRTRRSTTDDAQHALAAGEAKPRRRAAAKSRRTQRSTRK